MTHQAPPAPSPCSARNTPGDCGRDSAEATKSAPHRRPRHPRGLPRSLWPVALRIHLLAKTSGPLKPPDLNATDDTVVLGRLEELKTVANRLTVKVLVASQESDRPDSVIISLHRAKGPLIFDLGICLVLFALPALAFAVAIQIALGKRKFVPPFVTWFAAMLFAVIPILIWVLIALAGATAVYMVTCYRQSE